MYVSHLPSGDSAVPLIRFQRAMSARPRTFFVVGSARVVPCGATDPVFCWAGRANADTSDAAIARRTEAFRDMRAPIWQRRDVEYTGRTGRPLCPPQRRER